MKKLIKYEKLPFQIKPLVDKFVEHNNELTIAHSKLKEATPESRRIGKIMLKTIYDPNVCEFASALFRKELKKPKSEERMKLEDALISASVKRQKTRFELIEKLRKHDLLPEKHDFSINEQKTIKVFPEGESPGLISLLKTSEKNYKKLLEKWKKDNEPKK